MKKITQLIAVCLLSASVYGQAPQQMSYQAVIRNATNDLITSTSVGMQVSILSGSITGTAVYVETHQVTANVNGLVTIEIGNGTPTTGTFATIDWSTGPFFVKTETDPDGGTNYTISGTSQLMSVPYALYAETAGGGLKGDAGPSAYQTWLDQGNTGTEADFLATLKGDKGDPGTNGGKTILILTDNVTDAQAAQIMANDFGPNTQEIIIQDCSQLTTVDFSGMAEAVRITISDNTTLTSLNFGDMKIIYDVFSVRNCPALTTLNLSSLEKANVVQFEVVNTGITALNLPVLTKIKGGLLIQGNPALASATLSQLAFVASFVFADNDQLTGISAPVSLSNGAGAVTISNHVALTTLSLPNISTAGTITIEKNPSMTALDISALATCASITVLECGALDQLNLSGLVSASAIIKIANNALLTNIDLGALTTNLAVSVRDNVAGTYVPSGSSGIVIHWNPKLSTLNLGAMTASSGISVTNNDLLISVNFSSLASCPSFHASDNASLANVVLPQLTSGPGLFSFSNNASLTTINCNSLVTCERFRASDNASLANVLLPQLTSLSTFTLSNNASLTAIDINNLQSHGTNYFDDFTVENCPLLTELLANKLESAYALKVTNCAALETIGLTSFTSTTQNQTGIPSLTIKDCSALTTIDLSALSAASIMLIENNVLLTTLQISNLQNATRLRFLNNPNLAIVIPTLTSGSYGTELIEIDNSASSIDANLLVGNMVTLIIKNNTNLSSMNFSSLTYFDQILIDNNPLLTAIDFSSLLAKGSSISNNFVPGAGQIQITNNVSLAALNFPAAHFAASSNSKINFSGNTSLNAISWPNISLYDMTFDLRNCNFPTTFVDGMLNKAALLVSSYSGKLYLDGQTPAAPPSATGIADKNTLISRNWTVTTD